MNFSQFIDNWPDSRKDQFSYDAKRAIFDYLEEYEESTDTKVEFDPIAICCEYSEYASALDCIKDCGYSFTPDKDETPDQQEASALEWLQEQTTVLSHDSGIVIMQF